MKGILNILIAFCLLSVIPGACKKPSDKTKAIINIQDTLSKPVKGAMVYITVDTTVQGKKLVAGLPDTLFTGDGGQVTKEFSGGVVLTVSAFKDSMMGSGFIKMEAGQEVEKTIKLNRKIQ